MESIGLYFNALNLFYFVMFNPSIASGFLRFSLPDIFYVATYSREDRKNLIRKGVSARFYSIYLTTLVVMILPIFIYCVVVNDGYHSVLCITEAIIVYSILYSGVHIGYFQKCNKSTMIWIELGIFFEYIFFSGITALTDLWLIILLVVIAIAIILFCRIRYHEPMVSYWADYEVDRTEET